MIERIFDDEHEPFWRSAKQARAGPDPRESRSNAMPRAGVCRRRQRRSTPGMHRGAGRHRWAPLRHTGVALLPLGGPPGRAPESKRLERAYHDAGSEHAHFSLLWSRTAAAQRRVLQALAAEQPGRPLSSEYRRRHALPAVATVQSALAALADAELVARIGRGECRIAEPFLAEWIRLHES